MKSGSRLNAKCLHLLTGREPEYFHHANQNSFLLKNRLLKLEAEKKFAWTNNVISHDFLSSYPIKVIFSIRDYRDVVVSFRNFIFKGKASESEYYSFIRNMEPNEQISWVIEHSLLRKFAPFLKEWIDDPNILVSRFEDLIGSNDGGDLQKQEDLIMDIASFVDVPINNEKLHLITNNLFGNKEGTWESQTFHKGQIGQWKEIFTEEHKELFKKFYGQVLIDTGYEKDLNW